MDAWANIGVEGIGSKGASGPTNFDIAKDPSFLKPADEALDSRLGSERNRQAYVLEQQAKQFTSYEKLATEALGRIEDAFVQLFTTGEFSAKKMFSAITADLTRLATHQLLRGLLGAALGPGPNQKWASGQTSAYGLEGFASGTVINPRGGGRSDSEVMAFRTAPAETVRVHTPEQEAAFMNAIAGGGQGQGGAKQPIYITMEQGRDEAELEQFIVRVVTRRAPELRGAVTGR